MCVYNQKKLQKEFVNFQYMPILKCAIIVWYKTDWLSCVAQAMTDILNHVQGAPL